MKKLIMAAAIVCAVVSVKAATANWYVESISEYGTSSLATDYALFFVENAAYSQDDLSSAISSGDFSFASNNKVYAAEYMEDGEGGADGGTYANGESVTGYFVVFNAETANAATHFYISESDTVSTGGTGQPAAFAFDGSDTAVAGNWTSIGGEVIPEPTSGLLLLVGMAGLALRRRRA